MHCFLERKCESSLWNHSCWFLCNTPSRIPRKNWQNYQFQSYRSPAWKKNIKSDVCEDAQPGPTSWDSTKPQCALGAGKALEGFVRLCYGIGKSPWYTTVAKGYRAAQNKETRLHNEFESLQWCAGCSTEWTGFTYQRARVLQRGSKNAFMFVPASAE